MAHVTLTIGGRAYDLACRDGEEAHLLALGAVVDAHVGTAARAGGGNEARQLLMAALLLADELGDLRAGGPDGAKPDPLPDRLAATLNALAGRVEMLATRLENGDAKP